MTCAKIAKKDEVITDDHRHSIDKDFERTNRTSKRFEEVKSKVRTLNFRGLFD